MSTLPGNSARRRFDARHFTIAGEPVRVVGPVFDLYHGAAFDVAENGILVYEPQVRDREVVWVDREGRATPLSPQRDTYLSPRLSPDGTRVAVQTEDNDIWALDIGRDQPSWQEAQDRSDGGNGV